MKILLTSIGTRGDVEPFLAIGEILKKRGHEIIFSFPEQFYNITPKEFKFHPLSPKIITLIESKEGRIVMGKASFMAKIKAIRYLYKEGLKVNKELIQQQYKVIESEQPDMILHNVKCNYPLLWGMKNKKKTILISPVPYFMYYVKGHSHIGFNKNLGTFLNKLTYWLSNFGLVKTIYDAQKTIQEKTFFSKKDIKEALFKKKLIYTISTVLFKRPNYWNAHVKVLGYHERDKTMNWQPHKELLDFIESHDKIIFLTFGSMMNSFPKETSNLIYNELVKLKIPTIINIATGGLIELEKFSKSDTLFFVNQIPYDWVFKKVYGVMHHGGSGTTHSALKHGCASLIIPHIIDQFGWNNLISKIGAGPKGVSINKLKPEILNRLIFDVYSNKKYKKKALELSENMKKENIENELYKYIIQE